MNYLFLRVLILFISSEFARQQSAELDDLQKLCPNVRGIFCTHCSHKSVEQICPIECRFCGGGGTGFGAFRGFPLRQGAPMPPVGPIEARGMLPQNLGILRRQCGLVNGLCGMCKIHSISELCVDECLGCENGGGGGIVPTSIGARGDGDLLEEKISNEWENGLGDNSNGDSGNLLEIFRQLQKIEQQEGKQIMAMNERRNVMEEDIGAEEVEEEEMGGGEELLMEGQMNGQGGLAQQPFPLMGQIGDKNEEKGDKMPSNGE